MRVHRLSELNGVAIEGLDLSQPRTEEEDRAVARLFDEHGLVVFRGQQLTKRQLHDAGAVFGGAMTAVPGTTLDPDVPGIVVVSTRGADGEVAPAEGDKIVGDIEWHNDQSYAPRPPRGRMLYAVQVPPDGGLTGYIDGALTYLALSDRMKARIEDLHVIHSMAHAEATIARQRGYHRDGNKDLAASKFPDVAFRLVCRHPVTGIPALSLPPLWVSGIVELPGAEGAALIEELKAHILQPKFQYWHRYEQGDAVMWDNWRYIHAAGGTPARHARTLWSIASKVDIELGSVIPKAA